MIIKACSFSLLLITGIALQAQPKAGILNGPVTAINKEEVPLLKPLGSTRKYISQAIYLQKDDWLVVMAQSSGNPVSIDVYDRQSKKYIYSLEDTAKHPLWQKNWRSVLAVRIPRSDSFDVLCSARNTVSEFDDESSSDTDTVFADFSVARLNTSWQPSDTNWGMLQRLNYLASHWTAGFRTVSKTYDKDKAARDGKITQYFPEAQIAVDERLGSSIFPLAQGQKLVYFMYSTDTSYAAAKSLYDDLSKKLKQYTDYSKISDLSDMRRKNELATTYFGIKIPARQAPPEYSFLEAAGKNMVFLPVSLFLFGDKQKAKVLVVMGEAGSDVYDIGW
jgi:hypothetical protein